MPLVCRACQLRTFLRNQSDDAVALQLLPAYLTADIASFLGTRHRIQDAVLTHSSNAADPQLVVAGPAPWPADVWDVGTP